MTTTPTTISFKKLHPSAKDPVRGSLEAAGIDLHIIEHATIPAGKRAVLKTGIAMALPFGTVGLIWPRSKLAVKKGIDVLAGVVDSDYRGEIMVAVLNTSDETVELRAGDKAAQIIIQPHMSYYPLLETEELDDSERGSEGINSSDLRLR